MQGRRAASILAITAIGIAGCGGSPGRTSSATSSTTSSSPITSVPSAVKVSVVPCPIPPSSYPSDYVSAPYSSQTPPATFTLPIALSPLPNSAALFGTVFPLSASASYLIAPSTSHCQSSFASADGGMVMTATVGADGSQGVEMVLRPGGAGPSADLACPYIPAVQAADEAFRGGFASCSRPSGEVVQQIPTGVTNLYAAAVWVPPGVSDPTFNLGPGIGTDPILALFTASVTPPMSANGQVIACRLAPSARDVCDSSLRLFLTTESEVGQHVGSASVASMELALSTFVSSH